jgi:hypothetical protein
MAIPQEGQAMREIFNGWEQSGHVALEISI